MEALNNILYAESYHIIVLIELVTVLEENLHSTNKLFPETRL